MVVDLITPNMMELSTTSICAFGGFEQLDRLISLVPRETCVEDTLSIFLPHFRGSWNYCFRKPARPFHRFAVVKDGYRMAQDRRLSIIDLPHAPHWGHARGQALEFSVKSGLPGGRENVAVQTRQVNLKSCSNQWNTIKFCIFCYTDYCNNTFLVSRPICPPFWWYQNKLLKLCQIFSLLSQFNPITVRNIVLLTPVNCVIF